MTAQFNRSFWKSSQEKERTWKHEWRLKLHLKDLQKPLNEPSDRPHFTVAHKTNKTKQSEHKREGRRTSLCVFHVSLVDFCNLFCSGTTSVPFLLVVSDLGFFADFSVTLFRWWDSGILSVRSLCFIKKGDSRMFCFHATLLGCVWILGPPQTSHGRRPNRQILMRNRTTRVVGKIWLYRSVLAEFVLVWVAAVYVEDWISLL